MEYKEELKNNNSVINQSILEQHPFGNEERDFSGILTDERIIKIAIALINTKTQDGQLVKTVEDGIEYIHAILNGKNENRKTSLINFARNSI